MSIHDSSIVTILTTQDKQIRADLNHRVPAFTKDETRKDLGTYLGTIFRCKIASKDCSIDDVYSFSYSDKAYLDMDLGVITHRCTGVKYLGRRYDKNRLGSPDEFKALLKNEINIYIQINHPHILKLLEVWEDDDAVHLVFEYVQGCSIYSYLANNHKMKSSTIAKIAAQLLVTLSYLKMIGMAHRDLNGNSIMISTSSNDLEEKLMGPDSEPIVRICSIKYARMFNTDERVSGICGSTDFVSPEMLNGSYNLDTDIWSIGVLLYICATGFTPFQGTASEKLQAIQRYAWCHRRSEWNNVTPKLRDFIARLLTEERDRITIDEAMDHDFIKDHIAKRRPLKHDLNIMINMYTQYTKPHQSYIVNTQELRNLAYQYRLGKYLQAKYSNYWITHTDLLALTNWFVSGKIRKGLLLMYSLMMHGETTRTLNAIYDCIIGDKPLVSQVDLLSHLNTSPYLKKSKMFSYFSGVCWSLNYHGKGWISRDVFMAGYVGSPLVPLEPDIVRNLLYKFHVDDRGFVSLDVLSSILGTKITGTKLSAEKADFDVNTFSYVYMDPNGTNEARLTTETELETRNTDLRLKTVNGVHISELRDILYNVPIRFRTPSGGIVDKTTVPKIVDAQNDSCFCLDESGARMVSFDSQISNRQNGLHRSLTNMDYGSDQKGVFEDEAICINWLNQLCYDIETKTAQEGIIEELDQGDEGGQSSPANFTARNKWSDSEGRSVSSIKYKDRAFDIYDMESGIDTDVANTKQRNYPTSTSGAMSLHHKGLFTEKNSDEEEYQPLFKFEDIVKQKIQDNKK